MTGSRLTKRIVAAALLCGCLVASPGCYEKVVSASGFGAENVRLETPNGPDTRPPKTFNYKRSTSKQLPSPGSN